MPEGDLLLEPLSPETEPFDTPPRDAAPRDQAAIEAESLSVNVDGFEGPLDLLLTLARSQKVDLRKVSILQLAEQYLAFVIEASVAPLPWLDLAVGMSNPFAIIFKPRFWIHREVFEFGLMGAIALFKSYPSGGKLNGAIMAPGFCLGVSFDVIFGRIGVRLEGGLNIDTMSGGSTSLTFPITLAARLTAGPK